MTPNSTLGIMRQCIYCGNHGKMTKEHFYGEWLKKIVSPGRSKRTVHIVSTETENGVVLGKGKLHRPGPPYASQLRVVCEECNNGWLSKIQEIAKPLLIPLIRGDTSRMTADCLLPLAAYATMVTMTIQFADPQTLVHTSEQRLAFMNSKKPPNNWLIFCGMCPNPRIAGAWWHRAGHAKDNADSNEASSALGLKNNAHTTIFFLGNLFFYTISGPTKFVPQASHFTDYLPICQLWPAFSLRRPGNLSADEVYELCGIVWEAHGSSPIPHRGHVIPTAKPPR
jgi:hypothetical protein